MPVLNDCGRFLWERIPEAESEEALVEAMPEAYAVDRQTACRDVKEFLETLGKLGILCV